MKIVVNQRTIKDVILDIQVPSFWVSPDKSTFRAVLNEDTFINVVDYPSHRNIMNGSPQFYDFMIQDVIKENWEHCSEDVFFTAFNEVYASLNLTPIINL